MSLELVPRSGGGPPSCRRAELNVPQGKPNHTPLHCGCAINSFSSLSTLACRRFLRPPCAVKSYSKHWIPLSRTALARRPDPVKASIMNGPLISAMYLATVKTFPSFADLALTSCADERCPLPIAMSSGSIEGFHASTIYIVTYIIMSVGIWSVVSCLENSNSLKRTRTLTDLAMISKSNPVLSFIAAILIFSMAGVPPLVGFYAKFCVFTASINASMYVYSILIILVSVVSTYYYIRLIKTVYFEKVSTKTFYKPISKEISLVLGFSFFFTVFFFINPNLLWLITYEMVLCVVQ